MRLRMILATWHRQRCISAAIAVAGMALGIAPAEEALAYIGPSYLKAPNTPGWQGGTYKDWVKFESHYWGTPLRAPPILEGKPRAVFSPPIAPKTGAGTLSVALDKKSPALAALMTACNNKAVLPELTYAESSDRARIPAELGRRPADVPEYFEYRLKNVMLSCPVAANAPEQALVLKFSDIEWTNFEGGQRSLSPVAATLAPAQKGGRTKAYVVYWFWSANEVSADQCPVSSVAPTEEEYFAFRSPEEVAKIKAQYEGKGGVRSTFISGASSYRGPDNLSVGHLPGIVPDPGHPSPQTDIARGFNLDGNDGTGKFPASTRPHKNFVSPTGEKGIDNQLFTVDGCIKGFGPKGILTVTTTEMRRNGALSMMLLVSGIDDDKNDDRVDVTFFYSKDPMVKSASGKDILPGYTYRVSDNPEQTPYFKRMRGRIVDGVVLTEPVDKLEIDKGRDISRFFDARMRLELKPDGMLKGMVGGYQDWRTIANYWGAFTIFEQGFGYKTPGVYNALKRAADGLKDPVTGEYNGISTAFDIEGVTAYIPPEQQAALLGGKPDTKLADNRKK